jgi:hypothetical protein
VAEKSCRETATEPHLTIGFARPSTGACLFPGGSRGVARVKRREQDETLADIGRSYNVSPVTNFEAGSVAELIGQTI